MRNHSHDDFAGGRAAGLTAKTIGRRSPEAPEGDPRNGTRDPRTQDDLRNKWLAAGANDDLALALAMLALTEGR